MKILFTYPKSTGFKAGTIPTMSATLPHDWYHRLWLCLLNITYNQMLLHPWHQVAIMLGAHAAFHHFPSSSLSFLVSACHPAVQRTAAMPRNSEHSSFHLVFIYLPPSLVDSHTHTYKKPFDAPAQSFLILHFSKTLSFSLINFPIMISYHNITPLGSLPQLSRKSFSISDRLKLGKAPVPPGFCIFIQYPSSLGLKWNQ